MKFSLPRVEVLSGEEKSSISSLKIIPVLLPTPLSTEPGNGIYYFILLVHLISLRSFRLPISYYTNLFHPIHQYLVFCQDFFFHVMLQSMKLLIEFSRISLEFLQLKLFPLVRSKLIHKINLQNSLYVPFSMAISKWNTSHNSAIYCNHNVPSVWSWRLWTNLEKFTRPNLPFVSFYDMHVQDTINFHLLT